MVREAAEVVAGATDVLRFAWLAGLLALVTCSTPSLRMQYTVGIFAPAPGSDGAGGGGGSGM